MKKKNDQYHGLKNVWFYVTQNEINSCFSLAPKLYKGIKEKKKSCRITGFVVLIVTLCSESCPELSLDFNQLELW